MGESSYLEKFPLSPLSAEEKAFEKLEMWTGKYLEPNYPNIPTLKEQQESRVMMPRKVLYSQGPYSFNGIVITEVPLSTRGVVSHRIGTPEDDLPSLEKVLGSEIPYWDGGLEDSPWVFTSQKYPGVTFFKGVSARSRVEGYRRTQMYWDYVIDQEGILMPSQVSGSQFMQALLGKNIANEFVQMVREYERRRSNKMNIWFNREIASDVPDSKIHGPLEADCFIGYHGIRGGNRPTEGFFIDILRRKGGSNGE